MRGLWRLCPSGVLPVLLFFLGAAGGSAADLNIGNVLTCSLPGDEQELLVFNDPANGPVWAVSMSGILRFLPGGPDTPGWTVAEMSLSPDGEWLAVTTAAEGHTTVSLFSMSLILGRNAATSGTSLPPEAGYDGYPGLVFIDGWSDEWLLLKVLHDDKPVELLMLHPEKGVRPRDRTIPF